MRRLPSSDRIGLYTFLSWPILRNVVAYNVTQRSVALSGLVSLRARF